MSSGIYCIENKINNKKYIGQSINIEKRMEQHRQKLNMRKSECPLLQNAWNKYGEDSFIFYTIIKLPKIRIILNFFEIIFIKIFKSHVTFNGYNVSWGGSSPMKNRLHTQETKNKTSKNNAKYWLNKKRDEKTKNKISASKKGTHITDTHKENIAKKVRGTKPVHGNTSVYVGVSKRNDSDRFRSEIKFKGIRYKLGSFKTEIEAAIAYNDAYKKLNNTSYEPNKIL